MPITSGLPQPGRDDHIRPIAEHHRQAIRAAQLRERRLHRLDQRRIADRSRSSRLAAPLLELVGDQLGDHFGVGRRLAVVAALGQPLLELAEVFDDAVVHERDHVVAADVRMRVLIGRRAVRRPARVAEADVPGAGDFFSFAARSSIRPAVLVMSKWSSAVSSIVTTPLLS